MSIISFKVTPSYQQMFNKFAHKEREIEQVAATQSRSQIETNTYHRVSGSNTQKFEISVMSFQVTPFYRSIFKKFAQYTTRN